ncbi:MAG: acyl-CoA dehydrogenase family protein [Flammeovirgaceae bacterium]
MLHSPFLQANPSLYVFLPLFYTVWSDAILTPSEISTIEGLINSQNWLSKNEHDFLVSQLNPAAPPSANDLMQWKDEIKNAAELTPGKTLVDIGIKLVELRQGTVPVEVLKAKPSLANIESTLGFISHEAAFNFQAGNRSTITHQQATQRTFDVAAMTQLLDGKNAATIHKVKTIITDPEFQYVDPSNIDTYRERVLDWCRLLAGQGFGAMAYPKEYGGQGDMAAYFAIMETLSYHDLSMVIKFGVQFGLWGMSVYFLGTEKHHKKYLKDIGTLDLPGCFAMTETHHGSNVKGIETTATYQHATKTLTIHTPHANAKKEYIGNAAKHGQMATVFVKLIIDGKDYGVSAVVVPLRDKKGNTLPGITIEDCGRKMGLNGVDNGKIEFKQVVVPVENLLDRFAGIDTDGKFTSPIASDNRRFFTMLGTLVGGRIGIPRSGLSASKSGLTIAIKYSDQRKQFGPEGAPKYPFSITERTNAG